MRSSTTQADIAATAAKVWAALTSPAQTRRYFSGLSITSAWRPDADVDARHGATLIATGTVVVADKPSFLVYRLDEPQTGDIDCWLAWHLDESEPGITRVTLTADTLPADPPRGYRPPAQHSQDLPGNTPYSGTAAARPQPARRLRRRQRPEASTYQTCWRRP